MPISKLRFALCAATVLSLGTTAAKAEQLELMHFWTSGGEAAAIGVVKNEAAKAGIEWKDAAVAGGNGMNAYQVLQARVAAGNPPAAMQMHGAQMTQYANAGLLLDLSEIADQQGWDKKIVPDLLHFARIDGKFVGVPFNMHRANWMWINKQILDDIGAEPPKNWDEFFALGDKLKEKGITPLAAGGQPWQDYLLWEQVVLGSQSRDYFVNALVKADPKEIDKPEMRNAFEVFRKVLSYTDTNRANQDWNLATANVINGQAAMQMMGDWALGEFTKAGKTAGKDFVCVTSPGTEGVFDWNADFWGFFRGLNESKQEAQKKLAEITLDPAVQKSFNMLKGSSPAVLEVGADGFSPCQQKDIEDRLAAIKSGNMVGSISQNSSVSTEVSGVYQDAVTQFAADPNMTPDQAVDVIIQGLSSL